MELDPYLSPQQNENSKITEFSPIRVKSCFDCPGKQIKDAVYFLILRMVNNKIESEKLTEIVFIEAKSQFNPRISKQNYSTWLFQMASGKAKEYLRTKNNHEMAEINRSILKYKHGIKLFAESVLLILPLGKDRSHLQICINRDTTYLKSTNSLVQNIKIYSASDIANHLYQQFEAIKYSNN